MFSFSSFLLRLPSLPFDDALDECTGVISMSYYHATVDVSAEWFPVPKLLMVLNAKWKSLFSLNFCV